MLLSRPTSTRAAPVSGLKTLAGITRHVRFHDLRQTCTNHLVSGTWRLEEVRDYLDHSNISVAQR